MVRTPSSGLRVRLYLGSKEHLFTPPVNPVSLALAWTEVCMSPWSHHPARTHRRVPGPSPTPFSALQAPPGWSACPLSPLFSFFSNGPAALEWPLVRAPGTQSQLSAEKKPSPQDGSF